jgi:precorrin-6A/cobalt-precorrin-6A reductase
MIAIFAGTKDGREITEKLVEKHIPLVVFTATAYGKSLIGKDKSVKIYSHPLDKKDMEEVFVKENIKIIIDATHPYAENISKNLICVSKTTGIKYIRYERPSLVKRGQEDCRFFKRYEEILGYLMLKTGNILLTTGSNNLGVFTENIVTDRLYARVLPVPEVINKCYELGLGPKNIIAMEGPFSRELNEAIIKSYNIKFLVTKDSGEIGGMQEKIDATRNTDCELIVLERPILNYGDTYKKIEDIVSLF